MWGDRQPGIICIVCHHVLCHPSEHRTGSMGRHLLRKSQIAKLNKLTESEVTELSSSTVNGTALATLTSQGSRGITIVSVQRKSIFDIQVYPYRPKWQAKRSKLAAEDFETSEFHQDTWNCYLMLGFVSAHIPWNTLSNLELQRSYEALGSEIVLPSATTLRNICPSEYALTVNAIEKQLLSRNKVSLTLEGWMSMNKLAIMSVIADFMDRNGALRTVQPTNDEVVHRFFSAFDR